MLCCVVLCCVVLCCVVLWEKDENRKKSKSARVLVCVCVVRNVWTNCALLSCVVVVLLRSSCLVLLFVVRGLVVWVAVRVVVV